MAGVSLLVAGLAAADGYLRPERAVVWLLAPATMAVIWLVVGLTQAGPAASPRPQTDRGMILLSATVAGVILSVALAGSLVSGAGFASADLKARLWGVAIGLALVVLGNAAPKAFSPLTESCCSPARAQAVKRFAGWVFVLAGLAYAAVWVLLASPLADTLSTDICGGAVILVISRCAWAFLGGRRAAGG
jgi:hypothetical protein